MFGNITFGQSICGTILTFEGFFGGDTDWFKFTVPEPENRTVSATLTADFPAELVLVDGVDDCSTFDFDSSNANVAALDVAEEAPSSLAVSVNLPPGDYALIVSVT